MTRHSKNPNGNGLKRYNLALPEKVYNKLQALATSRHTTVVEILRRFITLGFIAVDIEKTPGASLLIREDERERELVLY